DVFVFEVGGFFEGAVQQSIEGRSHPRLRCRPGHMGKPLELPIHFVQHGLAAHSDLLQNRRHDAFAVFEEGGQQVERDQLGIAVLGSKAAGALHGLLRLYGKLVPTNCHNISYVQNMRGASRMLKSGLQYLPKQNSSLLRKENGRRLVGSPPTWKSIASAYAALLALLLSMVFWLPTLTLICLGLA